MTQGTVGWLCPKCSAVISPYEAACTKCAPVSGFSTVVGWSGTLSLGCISLGYSPSYRATSGTFYATPPKTDAQKLAEAKADAADWRDKFERVIEAMQEVIEEHQDDDDDD